MPEGDTIFRAARTLHQALAGRTVVRFDSVFPRLTRIDSDTPIRGRVIESIGARGKHLLMHFSGGLTLRTHMRMHGSWHLYRPGERWQRRAADMRILIATDAFEAVAFAVPDAEFLRSRELDRAAAIADLGPDPLGERFDAEEAVRRLAARGEMEIGDALLDQRAIAGIGNIWKSETLFVARVYPFVRVGELPPERLRALVDTAARLLRSERLGPFTVYGRGGEPCVRCRTVISRRKQGPHARSTYWCERCQPASPKRPGAQREGWPR